MKILLTCLVLPLLAEVHDDLGGASVEGVEVGPVLCLQALRGEVVNTAQTVHKFPETDIFINRWLCGSS